MSNRTSRHRAAGPATTPLTAVGQAVAANSGVAARRGAVVAATSGLVLAVGLPAAATENTAQPAATTAAAAETTAFTVENNAPLKIEAASFSVAPVTIKATEAPEPVAEAPAAPAATPATSERASAAPASRSNSRTAAAPAPKSTKSKKATAAPAADKAAPAPSGSKAQQIMAIAKQYIGTPYVFGGTTTNGWDCSGYISFVYKKVGVSLPRTSSAQASAGPRVSAAEAKPGDLVYIPGHIGIYAGNGKMYDAGNPRVDTTFRSISWMKGAQFIRVL